MTNMTTIHKQLGKYNNVQSEPCDKEMKYKRLRLNYHNFEIGNGITLNYTSNERLWLMK